MDISKRRVVVIGTGYVGSSYAFSLVHAGIVEELVLMDANEQKAKADAMDLSHGLPFTSAAKIWAGSYEDCKDAQIVVITAGANQKPGETRLDLVEKNAAIFKEIVDQVMNSGFDGIFLVATNPVDVMAYATWKFSNLPSERIIGSGTILDTARLRYKLGDYLQVDSRNVHAYIMGEHGDSEFPVWSHAGVGNQPLMQFIRHINADEDKVKQDLDEIFVSVRDAAYDIIQGKGATYYGIAVGMVRLTKAILQDEGSILTISALLSDEYGFNDVYIGVPAIIDKTGIRGIIELNLNEVETAQMKNSVEILKKHNKVIKGN